MQEGERAAVIRPEGLAVDGPVADIDLGGPWSFAITPEPVDLGDDPAASLASAGVPLRPAWVPGNVELDLERNGDIGDPFVGMAITRLRWLERSYVYYLRTFRAPPPGARSPVLVFEGLDCDARILLNGRLVTETSNMLVEHRIQVGPFLRHDADNLLVVELSPVLSRAERMVGRYPPGLQAEGGGYASLHIRKAPHMFGWDIMPRALSAGIWRPVSLRYLAVERIESLWLDTETVDPEGGTAMLALHHGSTAAWTHPIRTSWW